VLTANTDKSFCLFHFSNSRQRPMQRGDIEKLGPMPETRGLSVFAFACCHGV